MKNQIKSKGKLKSKHLWIILLTLIFSLFVIITFFTNNDTLIQRNSLKLYYTNTITKDEAVKLVDYLSKMGFDEGNTKSCRVNKNQYIYEITFPIKKGLENDSETLFNAKITAKQISINVFNNERVDLLLSDENSNILRTVIY